MDDTILKSVLNQARGTRPNAPGTCLDDTATALFVAGRLSGDRLQQAVDHVAVCDDCMDRITAITELQREAPAEDISTTLLEQVRDLHMPLHPPVWWQRRAPLAMAATFLLMVIGGLLLSNPQLFPWRNASEYREVRSVTSAVSVPALRFPKNAQTLRRSDLQFNWTQVDDGLYYEVQLLSGNGDMLWQDRTEAAASAPPGSLYLEPGHTFYVWVRAYLRDGKTVKSQAVSFIVLKDD